jgi:hypothetical protein
VLGRAVGGVVASAGTSLGARIGGGDPVATRGCVGVGWWTGGHPTRGRGVGDVVVGAGALVSASRHGGDWGWAEQVR